MSNQHQASAGPSSGRPRNQQDGTAAQAPRGKRPIQYRGLYQRDLPNMMYGFGDSRHPDQRSIELMERLTITFLVDLCHRCRPAPYSHPTSSRNPYLTRSRVKIDDLRFALRKDEKKLARLDELVYLDGVISGAKKILSTDVVDDVARQVEAEERQRANERGEVVGADDEDDQEGEAVAAAATVAGAAEEGGGAGGGGGAGRGGRGRGRGRGGGAAGGDGEGGGGRGRKRKRGAANAA